MMGKKIFYVYAYVLHNEIRKYMINKYYLTILINLLFDRVTHAYVFYGNDVLVFLF